MARLTADERASLAALTARAQQEDEQDAGLELAVQTESGHTVKLTGDKAVRFARKHKLDFLLEEDSDDDEGEELEEDPAPAGAGSIFRGRGKK